MNAIEEELGLELTTKEQWENSNKKCELRDMTFDEFNEKYNNEND